MLQYYYRDQYEAEACDEFDALTKEYPAIRFFQPSPERAPWHVQCVIEMADGDPATLNFWPHKRKAQRQYCHSREGEEAARQVIEDALWDQALLERERDTFSVIDE